MEQWRDGGTEGWRDGGMEGWRDGRIRVRPVPDPAEKPQPFSAVGLLLTRTSQSLADMQTES